MPSESTVWLAGGLALLPSAAGTALAAATLADDVEVSAWVLWVTTFFLAVLALVCFLAHWDVNRGRRVRYSEIEEEHDDLVGPD